MKSMMWGIFHLRLRLINELEKVSWVRREKLPKDRRFFPRVGDIELSLYTYLLTYLLTYFTYFTYLLTYLLAYLLIYLRMAVLGLRFCARAFSSCGKWGQLLIAVRRPLTIAASLVAEHRLQTRRLSTCGSRA